MEKLSNYKYTMDSCNHCGQCKWIHPSRMHGWDFSEICPIFREYGFDACSGQGLINIAKEIMNGTLQYGDGLEKMLYSCTACGACDVNCKSVRDMEVLDCILALREDCACNGTLPEAVTDKKKKIEETHNIYGLPHSDRWNWIPEDCGEDPDSDTVLFLGCAASYRQRETALAAMKLLRAGGVSFRLLREEEWCCGGILWRNGQTDAAEKVIRRNLDLLHGQGVRTLITTCGECFGFFRGTYPRFGTVSFRVRHISEVAAELLEEGKLKFHKIDINGPFTYHDPCLLGRLSEEYVPWDGTIRPYGLHEPEKVWRRGEFGVYDPPRVLLRAIPGLELREMPRNCENAFCCGAHAADADPEFASATAAERRREAKSIGAQYVVTACPFCEEALLGSGENAVPCMELTRLLADALEGGEG